MGWRSSRARRSVETAASKRLEQLARQWRPEAAPPEPDRPPDPDPWRTFAQLDDPDPTPRHVRVSGWSTAATRALIVIVVAGLAVAGWWWVSGRPHEVLAAPSRVEASSSSSAKPVVSTRSDAAVSPSPSPSPSPAVVVVHVAGQVLRPGLVHLPLGARVADAVAAAGGVTRQRAADSVNLARLLVDGEQIVVGATAAQSLPGPTVPVSPSATPLVDLNLADAAALDLLPGVGPVLAGRIIEWRAANGPFRSVDELREVSGIGDATFAELKPLVKV